MAGTPSGAPRCALCGSPMREERGMERENAGLVQRWWSCPRCLHRSVTTKEERGAGAVPEPGEPKEDRWQTR